MRTSAVDVRSSCPPSTSTKKWSQRTRGPSGTVWRPTCHARLVTWTSLMRMVFQSGTIRGGTSPALWDFAISAACRMAAEKGLLVAQAGTILGLTETMQARTDERRKAQIETASPDRSGPTQSITLPGTCRLSRSLSESPASVAATLSSFFSSGTHSPVGVCVGKGIPSAADR